MMLPLRENGKVFSRSSSIPIVQKFPAKVTFMAIRSDMKKEVVHSGIF